MDESLIALFVSALLLINAEGNHYKEPNDDPVGPAWLAGFEWNMVVESN